MNTIIKIARSHLFVGLTLIALIALAGCGGGDQKAQQPKSDRSAADAPPNTQHDESPASQGGDITIAGVTVTPPDTWKNIGASGMRQAQFRMPPVEGDPAEGEVNVFYFGQESGGGVEANLDRWIGQITPADGTDPAATAERSTFSANGIPGHLVSLNGSYKSGGGRPMGGEGVILPDYRLVGVVLEGAQGSVFFKLTGPEATARAMEDDFWTMVKGARQ